jgi:hypothetical protein
MTDAEYLMTIAEIDASYFVLEQMAKRFDNRAPIVQMIDKATGFEEAQLGEVKAIVGRIKELQGRLPADDPHFVRPGAQLERK